MAPHRHPRLHLPTLIAALLLAVAWPAQAQPADGFQVNAGLALQTDSNLFRLPSGADAQALLGRPDASDTIAMTSVGLRFHKPYSLQRIELDASLVDYRYSNFDYLSFTALNYQAAWRWSLTPRFTGSLTSERQQMLNSYADYAGYLLRNVRTTTATRFDAVYELDGAWRVLGGLAHSAEKNQQAILAEGAYSAAAAFVGVRRVFGTGSSLTYTLKSSDGTYLNRVLPSPGLYDDGFTQLDNDFRVHWVFPGKGVIDANLTPIRRTHPHYPTRDYDGVNAGLKLNWTLSGKLGVGGGWTRSLGSWQSAESNYVRTDRFSLGPVWQVSNKMVARLQYEWAQLDYLGSPGALPPTLRADTTRDTALSFDWDPYRFLKLSAALRHATRASTLAGLDYSANIATLSAQFTY